MYICIENIKLTFYLCCIYYNTKLLLQKLFIYFFRFSQFYNILLYVTFKKNISTQISLNNSTNKFYKMFLTTIYASTISTYNFK